MRPLLLVGLTAVALLVASCGGGQSPLTAETITLHFSHYQPGFVTARAGTPITLTLQNDDPIEHEWIVGTEAVHERHRLGTEPYHDQIPTEVTIPALSTRETTITFDTPGDYPYVCHLPGHELYGMRGILRVLPN